MAEKRRITFVRVVLAFLVTLLLGLVWLIPFQIGNFYEYQDQYAGDVLRGNTTAVREDLEKLEYFYRWNGILEKVWLDGPANKYLFYNAPYYRSAVDYLTGNYTKTAKDLENDDSFWALYIKGNIKWRMAQGMYRHGLEVKDKKEAERIKKEAEELAISSKDEYEEAIKKDLLYTFPPKWNYDLTNDSDARLTALLPKPKVRQPFGYPDPRGLPSVVPKIEELKPGKSEDLDKNPGSPQPKRGG
ncbi:MAG: hypothetical protein Q8R34_01460 [bacterium]|nr:hypothetical protein [bacterium]